MRKMKRVLPVIIAVCMCLSVVCVGCDSSNKSSDECSHNWGEATCISPRVCSECGATDGEALGHNWVEATCTTPKTCSVCSKTEGEILEHKLVEGVCERCGHQDKEYFDIEAGKEVYSNLTIAYSCCELFASKLYDAWYFAIYESDDISIYSTGVSEFASYLGLNKELVDQAVTEYARSCGYTDSQINSDNLYKLAVISNNGGAVYTVTRVFELSGMHESVEDFISESKDLLMEMSPDYEQKTALSTLKQLYSHVTNFYDFVKDPSGSFSQLSSTINSFKSDINSDLDKLEFIYE